ncbi:MAG TPA: Uma2 family endonuclease [Bryobacteraceae bacterium]|nr:Uma2 family endonuclease [Bryobacteraceae bacterium]
MPDHGGVPRRGRGEGGEARRRVAGQDQKARDIVGCRDGYDTEALQVRSRPCRVYSGETRVQVTPTGLYVYPDVIVVCGEPQFRDERRDTLLNPNLIVEVLSESTEAYDRGKKFEHYRTLESFTEYLLIASDRVSAELFTRQPDGRWLLSTAGSLQESLELLSVGCRLTLADVYEKVEVSLLQSAGMRPVTGQEP